jgi:hypothetical protein
MPANQKYLSSKGQRALKITAALIGGYLVSGSFHVMLSSVKSAHEVIILTSSFTFFIVWGGLMVLTFLARNGWKIWGLYLVLTLIFSLVIYILK